MYVYTHTHHYQSMTHEGSLLPAGVSSIPLSRPLLDHDDTQRHCQKFGSSFEVQYLKPLI